MEKIFETLKVQMSVPTTSSPSSNGIIITPTKKPFNNNNFHQNNKDGHNRLRRSSQNGNSINTFTVKKPLVLKTDRKKSASPSNFQQKRENTSPIDILFHTATKQQNNNNHIINNQKTQRGSPNTTNNNNYWRGSPPMNNYRGRENCTPPNIGVSSPHNYAGPKFIESPSPRSLPLPPLHWLQASRVVVGLQTQNSPQSLKVQN